MKESDGNKVSYIELLRIIAAAAVIMIHVDAILIKNYAIGSVNWNICAIIGSEIRWCIPLYLMISGGVFLDREQPISQEAMLKKYILRLLTVLIVWGAFFYFFELWIYDQPITIKNLIFAPINILAGNTGYHLWYLYTIIPVYLLIPILKVFVDIATREQQRYLLLVLFMLCSCFNLFNSVVRRIPQLRGAISIGITLPAMFAYVACVLAGYYMAHFELNSSEMKVLKLTAILSVLCMPIVNIVLSRLNNTYDTSMSEYSGICSISVAGWLYTRLKQQEDALQKCRMKKSVLNIGGKTFGIYLLHVIFVSTIFHKLPVAWVKLNSLLVILIGTAIVFTASFILTWLLKKVPYVNRIV